MKTFVGRHRFRKQKWYNTEGALAAVVLLTYLLYKSVTLRLPTDSDYSLNDLTELHQQGAGRRDTQHFRDVLSVREQTTLEDEKKFSFLNLGRWNSTYPEDLTSEIPGKDEELDSQKVKSSNLVQYGNEGKGIEFIDQVLSNEKIVSKHDFKRILNPKDLCNDPDLYFITYIHTAAKYRARRDLIRRTWGNSEGHAVKFKVLFVIGISNKENETLQQEIVKEYNKYGDILQEDFIDTYRNLTHKGLAALKWIENYCSHAKFVLKTDDDTFVNTYTYIRYMKSIDRMGVDSKNLILCAVWTGMSVSRNGKWAVTTEQFNGTSYPVYCSGCAFTFSIDVAIAIHKISYYVPFFWVDDAYITGILARRIGKIKHRNFRSSYELNSDRLKDTFNGPEWWRYIFSSDIHRFDEAEKVWNTLKLTAEKKWKS